MIKKEQKTTNGSEVIGEVLLICIKTMELDKELFYKDTPLIKRLFLGPFGPAIDFSYYREESENLSSKLTKLVPEPDKLDNKTKDFVEKLSVCISTLTEIALKMEEKAKGPAYAKENNIKLISYRDFSKLNRRYEELKVELLKTDLGQKFFGSYF